MAKPVFPGVKLVPFDWDGMAFDNTRFIYELNRRLVMERTGRDLGLIEWKSVNARCSNRIGFCREMKMNDSPEKITREFKLLYEEAYENTCERDLPKLFYDTEETLSGLRSAGKRLGLLSSSHAAREEAVKFGVHNYFSFIKENVMDKEYALRELRAGYGLGHDEIAYVDDNPLGIIAAKNAGVISIGKLGGYVLDRDVRAAKPDCVISDLSELLTVLR